MKETTFVNLIGCPGTGKSTLSSGIFYELKKNDVECEYIQEYAKDRTWIEDKNTLKCQPYVTAKQLYRQYRVLGKVDIAITDSPIILGTFYSGWGCGENWEKSILDQFNIFKNFNIFVKLNKSNQYHENGRNQTLDEALEIESRIEKFLEDNRIPFVIASKKDEIKDLVYMIRQKAGV